MVTTNSVSKEITEARSTMADCIVQEVGRAHGCELDALVLSLPGCDWHDVALEVHRLSRAGQLQVSACGGGIYTVRAPAEAGKRGGRRPFVKRQEASVQPTEFIESSR